jgi:hypothetical protein
MAETVTKIDPTNESTLPPLDALVWLVVPNDNPDTLPYVLVGSRTYGLNTEGWGWAEADGFVGYDSRNWTCDDLITIDLIPTHWAPLPDVAQLMKGAE